VPGAVAPLAAVQAATASEKEKPAEASAGVLANAMAYELLEIFWNDKTRPRHIRWPSVLLGTALLVAVFVTGTMVVSGWPTAPRSTAAVSLSLLVLLTAAFLKWLLWLLPWRLRSSDVWGMYVSQSPLLWVAPSAKQPWIPPRYERPTMPERVLSLDGCISFLISLVYRIISLLLVTGIAFLAAMLF
jgi:hypothetical protein